MNERIAKLTETARILHGRLTLDQILQNVTDGAARLLGAPRASLRLLNPGRTRLVAVCRSGTPLHQDPTTEFRLGEGLVGWIAQNQHPLRLGNAEADPRFLHRSDMREAMGSFLGVPLLAGATCMGVLSAVHPGADYFKPEDEQLLLLLATIAAPHLEIARLSRLSRVDGLTGALNRRGLDDAIPEVAAPEPEDRPGQPLSVVMVDVDHFKRVNDQYGHAVGDEVLRAVARRLGGVLRASDAVVRYGGEEFVLLLPGINLQSAARVAERGRKVVAESPVHAASLSIAVTISCGVAERLPGEARAALMDRADAAMYAAKRAGRNRVELAT